jgi:prepilin-type N-terminal cleavage/methylation domain-containing protein
MSSQRLRQRQEHSGFSLIELLVVLAIIAVLLGLGFPALTEWMVNNQIRNQAEYVRYGLQIARSEAINRNRFVRFQMVSSMDGNCTLQSTSNLWIVGHGDPTTATQATVAWADANGVTQVPADANIRCARDRSVMIPDYLLNPSLADTSPGNNPIIIQKGERERASTVQSNLSVITVPAVADVIPAICFNPSGQLARIDQAAKTCSESMHPANTAAASAQIDITVPATAGNCRTASGGSGFVCLRIVVSASGSTRLCDPVATAPDPRACT